MNLLGRLTSKVAQIQDKLHPKPAFTPIAPQLYHTPYPNDPRSYNSSLLLHKDWNKIMIFNLSEYAYPPDTLQILSSDKVEVIESTYQYYSSMPLTLAIAHVERVKQFIAQSQHNIVLIHCQQNMGRSIVFFSSYLYLTGLEDDIASALAKVCQALHCSDATFLPSQHSILRNIAHFRMDKSCINSEKLTLKKVIINQAPKIQDLTLSEDEPLKALLEIRCEGKLVFKNVSSQFGQGQILSFNIKNTDLILSDDCLFSIKYIHDKMAYPVARIQLNTNFIFNNFIRVQMQEMDIVKNAECNGQVFTDFIFEPVVGSSSELARLNPLHGQANLLKHVDLEIKEEQSSRTQKQEQKMGDVAEKEDQAAHEDDFAIDEFGEEEHSSEKLDEMLQKMAMKKINVEQTIKQEDEEQTPTPKKQDSPADKQPEHPLQDQQQSKQQPPAEVKEPEPAEQSQQDIDLDDYLSKLQQKALQEQ